MASYRVYTFNGCHIEKAEIVDAQDDAAAIVQASSLTGGRAYEVWQEARMIISVDVALTPLAAGTA